MKYYQNITVMGNQMNGEEYGRLGECSFIKKINGNSTLVRSPKTGLQLIKVDNIFATQQQLHQWMKENEKRKKVNHHNFLNSIQQQTTAMSNLCSKQYRVSTYFRNECYTLLNDIESRAKYSRHYQSEQIWSILCSSVLVMAYFTRRDITHTCLSPDHIIIDKDGVVKLLHPSLCGDGYMAPQVLKDNIATNKSAVFVLGITLLHALLLRPLHHIYAEGAIDGVHLQKHIASIEDVDVQRILHKMLKMHTYDRITFPELEEMLFQILVRDRGEQNNSEPYQILQLEESIGKVLVGNSQSAACEQLMVSGQDTPQIEIEIESSIDAINIDEEDTLERHNSDNKINNNTINVNGSNLYQNNINTIHELNSRYLTSVSSQDSLKYTPVQQERVLMQCTNICNQKNTNEKDKRQTNDKDRRQDRGQTNDKDRRFTNEKDRRQMCGVNSSSKRQQAVYMSEELTAGRYEGYKVQGMRHGFGSFYYRQGGKYSGEWVKNKMQGKGALYYHSGKLAYEGEWRADAFDGQGILYNDSIEVIHSPIDCRDLSQVQTEWIKYQGHFQQDLKQGYGTIFFSNGEYYRGCFKDDLPHGEGVYCNLKGQICHGVWNQGCL